MNSAAPAPLLMRRVPAALVVIALAASAVGQYALWVTANGRLAAGGYGLGLVAFGAALAISRSPRFTTPSEVHVHRTASTPRPVLIAVAFSLQCVTLVTLRNPALLLVCVLAWVISLAAGLAAAVPSGFSLPEWLAAQSLRLRVHLRTPEAALFVLIIAVATGLRLFRLDAYPSGIHIDEVYFMPIALDLVKGKFISPFAQTQIGSFGLFLYIQMCFLAVLGHTITAIRLLSSLAGLAMLPVFYLFVRRMFGVRPALLTLALLAGNAVTNVYGRHGDVVIFTLPLAALLLYSLCEAQRTRYLRWWFVTGLIAGLTNYFYYMSQMMVVVAAICAGYTFITQRRLWRSLLCGWGLAALGAAMTAGPAFILGRLNGPQASKIGIDLIFNNWPLVTRQQHTSTLIGVLVGQVKTNFLAFFTGHGGDINDFNYYTHSPLLPSLLGPFLILGLVLTAFRVRDSRYFLLFAWFAFFVLGPGALTIDSPRSWRLLPAVLPAVCIVALALDWLIAEGPALLGAGLKLPLLAGSGLVVIAAGYLDQSNFFWTAQAERPWEDSTRQGTYIASLGNDSRAYVMGNPNMYYNQWPKFLAPDTPGADLQNPADLPLPVPADRNLAFLVYGSMRDSLPLLKLAYPDGAAQDEYVKSGLSFTGYRTAKDQIAGQQGLTASYSNSERQVESDTAALGANAQSFPARVTWTGSVYAARNGSYLLRASGASEVVLDGNPLDAPGQCELWTGWHPIQISARLASPNSRVSLAWQPPGAQMGPIPPTQLYAQPLTNTLQATLQTQDGRTRQRWDRAIGFRDAAALWGVDKPATITWQGTLNIPRAGDYTLGVTSQGASEMTLDDQVVATNSDPDGIHSAKAVRQLAAGPHPISVRYSWLRDAAIIEAFWIPPGDGESIIPWSAFGPPA